MIAEIDTGRRNWFLLAVVGGVLLGAFDLLLQRTLPYPWANLANSLAPWAIGAFAAGRWLRRDWKLSAVAGSLLLVIAVVTYYVASWLTNVGSLTFLTSPTALVWLALGVAGGALFAAAGSLSRSSHPILGAVAGALPAAVLLAEATTYVDRAGHGDGSPHYVSDKLQTAAILAVLGIVVLVVVARGANKPLRTVLAAVVLAAAGSAAFLTLVAVTG